MGGATPRSGDAGGDVPIFIPVPIYAGWGLWSSWYGYGYGSPYGFGGYNPLGRSGFGSRGYSGGAGRPALERGPTGSIRFRVSPGTATIYIDGALAGTAAEFGGLTDHLELEGGAHQLELRADGYETYRAEIHVTVGKTMTERVTLKKK